MNNINTLNAAVARLMAQASAIGRLAQDAGGFAAAMAAFESKDSNAFQWVLKHLGYVTECEEICEWVRIKLCVQRCQEICGFVPYPIPVPTLKQFAQAIAKLMAHEDLLRRAVDAVACGNATEYGAVISELKLNAECFLLCRWLCSIIYREVCAVVCSTRPLLAVDPAAEVKAEGTVVAAAAGNNKAMEAIGRAAVAFNCETLRSAIDQAGFIPQCEIFCRLVCVWRCTTVCREFCAVVPTVPSGLTGIAEARGFALALQSLAAQPRYLGDLVTAVHSRDAKSYAAIVGRFGLEVYCEQLCAWICSEICVEFCYCVCPPELQPLFTSIGGLEYANQIDSVLPATGLTVGATQAFFSTLRLNGVLTQTLGGKPLEYTFEYIPVAIGNTTLKTAISSANTSITVASSAGFPAAPFNVVIGNADGGYEIMTVTAVSGTTWTVSRGQQSTTAAAAAAGAIIVTGAATSGAWTQVPPGWIPRTVLGYQEVWVSTPFPHLTIVNIAVNPNPGEIPATFTADGWIQVPQLADVFLNGNMINLDTTQLPSFPAADETGVSASNPINHPIPTDHYFGIRMRVRQAGASTSSDGGTCSVVAIDNTLYNNIDRHPEWGGGIIGNQYGVAMLDIKELQSAGCAGITDSLTVLFTAAHPNLGSVSLSMTGPGGPYGFTLPMPIPETGDWYGIAANDFVLADLPPCAYLVTLAVSLLLTTGDADFPGPLIDQIAFCRA